MNNSGKYILNSLSLGVKTIAEGKIKVEEVKYFITGTAFPLEDDGQPSLKEIMSTYGDTYWRNTDEDPDFNQKCMDIVRYLIIEKKIIQPRLILEHENSPYTFPCNAPCIGHSCKRFFETVEEWTGENYEDLKNERSTKHNRWIIERLRALGYDI